MSGHDAPRRDDVHTVTLGELEGRVAAAGVLISRRQLMRHCQAGTFDAKKLPATNNVEEWFIAPASIEKGIADIKTLQELRSRRDATRHDMTGHDALELQPPVTSDMSGHDAPEQDMSKPDVRVEREVEQHDTARHGTTDLDIYEHPYVKRLEIQVDKLETKLDEQVRRTEEIQLKHQERLIELQRMTTIGQSKTLAEFMLQAKNWIVGAEALDANPPEEEGKSTP